MVKNNNHKPNNLKSKYSHLLVHLELQIYTASQIYFEKNDPVFAEILPGYYEWRSIQFINVFRLFTSPSAHNDEAFFTLVFNAGIGDVAQGTGVAWRTARPSSLWAGQLWQEPFCSRLSPRTGDLPQTHFLMHCRHDFPFTCTDFLLIKTFYWIIIFP